MSIRTVQKADALPAYWNGMADLHAEEESLLLEVLTDNGLPADIRLIGSVYIIGPAEEGAIEYRVMLADPVLRWLFAVSLEMREEPFGPVLDALVTRRAAEVLR